MCAWIIDLHKSAKVHRAELGWADAFEWAGSIGSRGLLETDDNNDRWRANRLFSYFISFIEFHNGKEKYKVSSRKKCKHLGKGSRQRTISTSKIAKEKSIKRNKESELPPTIDIQVGHALPISGRSPEQKVSQIVNSFQLLVYWM